MVVQSARRRRAFAIVVIGGVTACLLIGGVVASMMHRKDAFTLYAFGPESYATGTVEVRQPSQGKRGEPVFSPRDFPPPVPSEKRDSGMGARE